MDQSKLQAAALKAYGPKKTAAEMVEAVKADVEGFKADVDRITCQLSELGAIFTWRRPGGNRVSASVNAPKAEKKAKAKTPAEEPKDPPVDDKKADDAKEPAKTPATEDKKLDKSPENK